MYLHIESKQKAGNRKQIMTLPRLYAIVDMSLTTDPIGFAQELFAAGVRLLQLRDKENRPKRSLSVARELKRLAPKSTVLIMNDRADLALAAGFNGVHVGQDDLSVEGARRVCPAPMIVGVSTHNFDQLREADVSSADYVAFGPIFSTVSKANPDPTVGLEGLRAARKLTGKPLVAIGGITLENCQSVIEAGADAVAVISALSQEPGRKAAEFLRILG
jgi:thiamine-phosphate pyrophosphorylase